MACEVEQAFRIAEVRRQQPEDGRNAFGPIAFEQRSSGNHELAKASANPLFELLRRRQRLVAASDGRKRQGGDIGNRLKLFRDRTSVVPAQKNAYARCSCECSA